MIEIEFEPSLYESPREILFKLHQSGSIVDYYTEFISLANRTNIEPHDALRDFFISGLCPEIKREVKSRCPLSLMSVVSLARLFEDKCNTNTKITIGPSQYRSPLPTLRPTMPPHPPFTSTLPPLLPTANQQPLTTKNSIKRMSPAKQQRRHEQGICFWCDDKYSPNHKCPNRHFMLYQLEIGDDCDLLQSETLEQKLEDSGKLHQLDQQVLAHHMSFNAMYGTSGPATIRVRAQINDMDIHALMVGVQTVSFNPEFC